MTEDLGMRGGEEGWVMRGNIQKEAIEVGAGERERDIAGAEEEEGGIEMEDTIITRKMVTITTRVTITGLYQCLFPKINAKGSPNTQADTLHENML